MKRSFLKCCGLACGCIAAWTFAGCHDDDEHVRDQPDGVYYEDQRDQNQYDQNQYDRHDDRTYDDRREYHGENRGWSVEINRYGDRDDDDDHDDHDHHHWDRDHDDDHHDHHGHHDHDDDDDDHDDDD